MLRWAWLAACVAAGSPALADDTAVAFRRVLYAAKANPAAADWTALRASYAADPTYDPFAGGSAAEAGSNAALQRNNARLGLALAEQALRQNWMDLRAQVLAAAAYRQLGDARRATVHDDTVALMLRAMLATGNGASAHTAVHVLAASEEYVLLQSKHLRAKSQMPVRQDGHWLDVVNVVHVPDGKRSDFYFNVDAPRGREDAIATGHAKPAPDSQLP